MKKLFWLLLALMSVPLLSPAQTFVITGTEIPSDLLHQTYGTMPKSISAYDISICNVTAKTQSIVSSEIYQALSQSNAGLRPIGRQIMLAAILRSQSRSFSNILTLVLNSASGVLSALGGARSAVPPAAAGIAALGAISVQQLLSSLKPSRTADQVEKFENEVLEPALVLDAGSCVERTLFVASSASAARPQALHIQMR